MLKTLLCFAALICVSHAHASINISNGKVTINVSGGDADSWGESGSSAGTANIHLAYEDAAKTIVAITGTTVRFGRTSTINERISLKELRAINIYAVGGSGANGYPGSSGTDGRDGQDGRDGTNGHDGCPPGDGGRGSDGSNGSDGTDGRDGGDAGHGGRGGAITVSTAPEQSELMLFVKTATGGGSGGNGGPGGRGGDGGRAGRGGDGGRGGSNTCKDEKGNPKWGPPGSSGWRGNDGRSGSSGRSGSYGRNGGSGRSGSRSFNLVDATGTQTFAGVFDLDISEAKFIDGTGDEILQPGERLYLKSLKISNKGPMPSPKGQTIRVSVLPSKTAMTPAPLSVDVSPIGATAVSVSDFKKGALTLQTPVDNSLIGKKVTTSIRLSINNISFDAEVDTGMAIRWPLTLTAATSRVGANFEVAKALTYTLKNVGSAELGPNGSQPVFVSISWNSKTVPGSDVYVTMGDGRVLNLAQPALLSELTVPAKGSLVLPLNLKIRDTKLLTSASGELNVSLRLRDMHAANEVVLQNARADVTLRLDTTAIPWNQTLNLAGTRIQCLFPNLGIPAQPMASVEIAKAAGADKLQIRLKVPGTPAANTSPVITASASKMITAYQQFSGAWTPAHVVDFLNQTVAPNSPRGSWNFRSCSVAP